MKLEDKWIFMLSFLRMICCTLLQGQLKYDNFYHLYCRLCEKSLLPSIWKEHCEKLSDDISIERLIAEWDRLGLSWNNIDILGCFLPNKEDHTVVTNNFLWDQLSTTINAINPQKQSRHHHFFCALFRVDCIHNLKEWKVYVCNSRW